MAEDKEDIESQIPQESTAIFKNANRPVTLKVRTLPIFDIHSSINLISYFNILIN